MSTPGVQTMFCAHGCAETHWKSMGGMGSYLRVFGQIRRIRISTAQLLEIQERTRGISNATLLRPPELNKQMINLGFSVSGKGD